ncbi:MAG: hypothetical protein ACJAUP_003047 [Cellvibrionaceae bacterium]|jgi:hypothetical protein
MSTQDAKGPISLSKKISSAINHDVEQRKLECAMRQTVTDAFLHTMPSTKSNSNHEKLFGFLLIDECKNRHKIGVEEAKPSETDKKIGRTGSKNESK